MSARTWQDSCSHLAFDSAYLPEPVRQQERIRRSASLRRSSSAGRRWTAQNSSLLLDLTSSTPPVSSPSSSASQLHAHAVEHAILGIPCAALQTLVGRYARHTHLGSLTPWMQRELLTPPPPADPELSSFRTGSLYLESLSHVEHQQLSYQTILLSLTLAVVLYVLQTRMKERFFHLQLEQLLPLLSPPRPPRPIGPSLSLKSIGELPLPSPIPPPSSS